MKDKTLDCSDLDHHMGKPIAPGRLKEPLANNDIRRWAQAMHYPNPLHYDDASPRRAASAASSRRSPSPSPPTTATAPARPGRPHPRSHLIFGGDEWWFYGPRIFGGDQIHNERMPFDYKVKETKFAGPTCFQRGDNHYFNQRGERSPSSAPPPSAIARDLAREMGSLDATEDPEWTDAELAELEEEEILLIKSCTIWGTASAIGTTSRSATSCRPASSGRTASRASPPSGAPTC